MLSRHVKAPQSDTDRVHTSTVLTLTFQTQAKVSCSRKEVIKSERPSNLSYRLTPFSSCFPQLRSHLANNPPPCPNHLPKPTLRRITNQMISTLSLTKTSTTSPNSQTSIQVYPLSLSPSLPVYLPTAC